MLFRSLPEGLNAKVYNDGQLFPKSVFQKILLARALVHQPKIILLEDCFENLREDEKVKIVDYLLSSKVNASIIAITNDPYYLSKCDNNYIMTSGKINHA